MRAFGGILCIAVNTMRFFPVVQIAARKIHLVGLAQIDIADFPGMVYSRLNTRSAAVYASVRIIAMHDVRPRIHRRFITVSAIFLALTIANVPPLTVQMLAGHVRRRGDLLRVHMPHRTQHIEQKNKCANNRKPFHSLFSFHLPGLIIELYPLRLFFSCQKTRVFCQKTGRCKWAFMPPFPCKKSLRSFDRRLLA